MGDEYIKRQDALNAVDFWAVSKEQNDNLTLAINMIPAADVVEVRHGRWCLLSYDEAVCSCCGYDRNTPFESTKEAKERWNELPPFCEICGAKMEGDGEC